MAYYYRVMIMVFERIKNIREDRDVKQREIAAILNVSQNTYSQYETGIIALSAENAAKLAKFYGVSVDYLLGLTDEKKPYKRKK